MGADINFNNITYIIIDKCGELITMDALPFSSLKRALTHRIVAEEVQRKYSRK